MCIFCKIVNKEIPSYTIYEDNICVAFLDLSQANIGHTLVVSKKHYNNILDISRLFSSDPPKKQPNKKPGMRALKKRLIPGFFSFMPSAGNTAKRTISQ